MRKSNSKSNTNVKSRANAKTKSKSKGLANSNANNKAKPSASSQSNKQASTSGGSTKQGKSNKNTSDDKSNAKNNKMTDSSVSAANHQSPSPSSGRDGIIVPPKAKAKATSTSTTTVTSTNLASSMEGVQIEEPSSSSGRDYDRDSRDCPKANRVHTLVHRIGKGRFSEVYSCSKASASIGGIGMGPYAIKIVSKNNKKEKSSKNGEGGVDDVEMAQEEVRIHRRLVHENIVRCPHTFTDGTNTYLILELCHNESIKHMLHRRQSHGLTEPEVKYYLKQLVGALKYLHDERYVVHRNIQPTNLLLDKNMQLKLSDFGLARELQATQTNGGCATIAKDSGGSPAFMAPESIKTRTGRTTRHTPSFEVDVWSVGVICFNTLVGQSPFATDDNEVTYQRILDNEYDFPDGIDVAEDARDLIGRLLRTDPSDRLSLDEIDLHPFLSCDPGQIPKSIPQSATHVQPEWRTSKKGAIYATNPSSASKSSSCLPNINKETGELESGYLELPLEPTAEEPYEPEEADVEEEEANNTSSNNLTPEGEARAAFFAKERAHQQLYTKAMIEWGVAEYARRQTQKQRRANKRDQFARAFVDPEEIKENSDFMGLLTKKCEQAYKSLYGHRTGGTVKILDNVDPNVLGKHGKIIAVDEDPNDPEKITFKIEIQEKMMDGTIAYATALPSDIEMRNKGDGDSPKKNGKRGKKGKKKKGGKNSSSTKSATPSEYVITLKPIFDVDISVTKPNLDGLVSEPSEMIYILDDMMAKRNEEEERKEVELRRNLEESKKADLEALEKEELSYFSDTVKMFKKTARRFRSAQNVDRVPLSERIQLDELRGCLFGASEKGMSDRMASMFEDHLELVLDSITDLFDVFDAIGPGAMDLNLVSLYKLLAPKRELMLMLHILRDPEETAALPIFLELLAFHTDAVMDGNKAFLLFEDFAFASVDASDPRLALLKMKASREMDDEEPFEDKCEEDLSCCAELLGISSDADVKTIMKAFRKKSMQCHPDKAESNGLSAEQAEEKFKALSAAKSALLASAGASE